MKKILMMSIINAPVFYFLYVARSVQMVGVTICLLTYTYYFFYRREKLESRWGFVWVGFLSMLITVVLFFCGALIMIVVNNS